MTVYESDQIGTIETPYVRAIGATVDPSCGCAMCAGDATVLSGVASSAQEQFLYGNAAALPYYVSALLPAATPRWNEAAGIGAAANVTFSFMTQVPDYAGYSDYYGFAPMSATQKAAARTALATWADIANITFTEVSDAGAGGSIRFGTNDQGSASSGYAWYPSIYSTGGDVYIASNKVNNTYPSTGNYGFLTLIHEIGHAIGLKHPGNYNSTGGGAEAPYLPTAEDNNRYSVMSYSKQSSSDYDIYASAPALYDVAAIQYVYGANTKVRSGNDTYDFSNKTSPFTKVIWDGGGIDTIDASGQSLGVEIDLGPGKFSSIGVDDTYYFYATPAVDNVSIAYGAEIENAIGGSGSDTLIGNDLNNSLSGGSGNDSIKGASGDDVIKGDAGSDQLWGGNGNDTVYGGADVDNLYGEAGDDILDGGAGGDYILGGVGNDNIFGGDGSDYLYGEDGNDILNGDTGSDYLYGGAGIDTAVWHLPKASYKTISLASSSFAFVYDGTTYDYMPDSSIEYYKFTDGTFSVSNSGTAAQVYRLYGAALGRTPDNSGLKNWISAIESGALTLKQAVSGFTSSTEFLNRYGNPDNKTFVTLLYKNVLGRTPDPGGLTNWTNALSAGMSRSDAVLGFSESAEDMERSRTTVEKGLWLSDDQAARIARLYHATLNRLPEAGGLVNWTAALKSGTSLLQISDGFTGSAEFQQKYGSLNNTAFVTLLYKNVLGRSPDNAGLANWTNALDTGSTRASVVVGFSESDEHISKHASYIDDGIKLYGSSPSAAGAMAFITADGDAASSAFVDRVAQLGLLNQSTLSAATSLTTASLTEPQDRFGVLASAA